MEPAGTTNGLGPEMAQRFDASKNPQIKTSQNTWSRKPSAKGIKETLKKPLVSRKRGSKGEGVEEYAASPCEVSSDPPR